MLIKYTQFRNCFSCYNREHIFNRDTKEKVSKENQYFLEYFLTEIKTVFSSVLFSCSVMSDSLWPHESQHARPPCPSPTPGVYPNSCPLSRWCHPTISSCFPLLIPNIYMGLPRWLSLQCRRHEGFGFDPWVRKIPWGRKWILQYSCLKSPMDREAWPAISKGTHDWTTKKNKKKYTLCFKVLLLPPKCFFLLQEMLIITSTA